MFHKIIAVHTSSWGDAVEFWLWCSLCGHFGIVCSQALHQGACKLNSNEFSLYSENRLEWCALSNKELRQNDSPHNYIFGEANDWHLYWFTQFMISKFMKSLCRFSFIGCSSHSLLVQAFLTLSLYYFWQGRFPLFTWTDETIWYILLSSNFTTSFVRSQVCTTLCRFSSSDVIATTCFDHTTIIRRHTVLSFLLDCNSS
jgi:hypothetical protein